MNDSISTPVKAKKTPSTKGKTQVGRPGPAANETLPLVAWALPLQAVMRKLEILAADAAQIEDVTDGSDTYAHRIDMQIALHFKNARMAVEQGKHTVESVIEAMFDAKALLLGAKAVDVGSPNRETRHDLMLGSIDAVINCQMWEGLDDAELALVAAGIPAPKDVPVARPKSDQEAKTEQKVKPAFITKDTPMSLEVGFGRILALDASFDIEGAALQLIRRSRELDLPPEDGAELRSIGIRIKDLNSALMSSLSEDDALSMGDVHHALYRGAVPFPEGVKA